jgi:hypothetical protein
MEKRISDRLDSIQNQLKEIFELKVKDAKVLIIEFLSLFMAYFSSALLFAGMAIFFLLFLSLGLGSYLNEVFQSSYLGFIAVAGAFILTLIVLIMIRINRGSPYFTNTFVKLFVKLFYYGKKDNN